MAADKKLIRSHSGLRMITQDASQRSPLVLDEPVWVPDSQCQFCSACRAKFDFVRRRHHCRRCGQCFCSKCCYMKSNLTRMCFVDPVLQCNSCLPITNRENEFFNVHLKTLQQETQLKVSGSVIDGSSALLNCRLSLDERFLVFDSVSSGNPFISYESIELLRTSMIKAINSKTMSPTTSEPPGSPVPFGLTITYKDCEEQTQTIELSVSESATPKLRKQAMAWLSALLKVKKFLAHSQ